VDQTVQDAYSFPCCRFLGCSGQNVEDIFKFSTLTDRLQILENTLHWRHLAPTAPDTLSRYLACILMILPTPLLYGNQTRYAKVDAIVKLLLQS